MKKIDKIASEICLDLIVAKEFPEQAPESKNARWYHLLWLMFPIIGILIFIEAIEG